MELRGAHREKVARNEVRVSPLWAQPSRGYNVQIELDPRTRSSLATPRPIAPENNPPDMG